MAPDPGSRPSTATVANRLRGLEPLLDGLEPLPALTADAVTWWRRELVPPGAATVEPVRPARVRARVPAQPAVALAA